MPKITKRTVDALIANEAGTIIRDEALKGFGARRNANGTVSFFVEYRPGAGGRSAPVRRVVLKIEPPVTPDRARSAAEKMLADVVAGADPAAKRAAKRREKTVADLLDDVLTTHWKAKRKASTAAEFARTIEHDLKPAFGKVRISELTRAEVRRWHAENAHRPRQANHSLAVLRKAFNVAIGDELVDVNPCEKIPKHTEKARDRVPTKEEMKAIWAAIDAAPGVQDGCRLLFKLLILTGLRSSEWAGARWADVDLAEAVLNLADSKTGARAVPLAGPVVALLKGAARRSAWVCPNAAGDGGAHPSPIAAGWKAVLAEAKVKNLRVHDLRHGFATFGAALGGSALVLRDALGHSTTAMTSKYVGRQDEAVRALGDRVAGFVLGVAEGRSAEVRALPKKRRGTS